MYNGSTVRFDDSTGFMLKQYKAQKDKLISNFIVQLVSPPLISTRSIHTVKMVIDRFYGDEMKGFDDKTLNDDLSKLEMALT